MKILFVNYSPPSTFLSKWSFPALEVLPKSTRERADVIFYHWTRDKLKESIKPLRKGHPTAWIVVLADKDTLKDVHKYQELLDCSDKDDVSGKESLPDQFWLVLQRAAKGTAQAKKMRNLEKEYEDLAQSTRELISKVDTDLQLATEVQREIRPKVSP